jgi:MoaA/NifB/PqqE/SkfB family radical SAM enzyme
MNSLLANLRLKWFLATNALDCSADFANILYRIYLNHNKIIHFRHGYPVYSLSTPALFSKPAANFISRILYRSIQNKNLPNMMSFAVNDVCNATCEHCSFFTAVEEKGRDILTLEQSKKLIQDSQDLGVSVINFVGGEPLLRADLPEIIRSVNKDFSTTILFTNGWSLAERAMELKKAGLDSVYVSIDSANREKHDHFRGKSGLFDQAIQGIKQAKKLGFSCGISTTMTPESYQDGELDRIVELAKEIGIHEVLVFDALPTGRYKERQDLVDNHNWVEEMIHSARKYNQNSNYPGVVFFAYFSSYKSVGCSCGTSYFYTSPYGDIMSCDFNHAKFGNVLEQPLWKIWDRLTTLPEFCQAKWGGCKIKDSEFRQKEVVSGGQ